MNPSVPVPVQLYSLLLIDLVENIAVIMTLTTVVVHNNTIDNVFSGKFTLSCTHTVHQCFDSNTQIPNIVLVTGNKYKTVGFYKHTFARGGGCLAKFSVTSQTALDFYINFVHGKVDKLKAKDRKSTLINIIDYVN